MRVGIDARLCMGERTGIGSYTAHLIEAFAGLAPEDEFALFTDRPMDLPGPNFSNPVVKMPKRIVWTYYSLPRELRKHRLDLFHGTTNFELPPTRSCRLVSTIHDLIPLRFPEFVSKKFYLLFRSLMNLTMRISDRVITVSEFSRRDILERYSIDPAKVVVIPEAPHRRFGAVADDGERERIARTYGLRDRYLLFVGVFEPRKNIPFLVDAFTTFSRGCPEGKEIQLALAGGSGHRGEEITARIADKGLDPSVRLLGYVPDDDLPALYRGADLVVVPSTYEGFGLPLLEAMACGTPVLAADNSSLPEVAGDAGALFSLDSPDTLAGRLADILASEETLKNMSAAGLRRAGEFTWEKTALRTLEVYRDVAGRKGTSR